MPCFFKDGYQMQPRVIRPVFTPWHLLWIVLFTVLVYGEWWDPAQQSRTWPILPAEHETGSVRLLLVADPQLQGEEHEPTWPLGVVTRWDSDRYLRAGFQRAFNHVLPDVVVFLGDLLDEGSVATEPQYDRYVQRFRSIFDIPRNAKVVYAAGDNDIGGEDAEPIKPYKVRAFQRAFGAKSTAVVDFVQFYMVPQTFAAAPSFNGTPLADGVNVLVSHFPVSALMTAATRQTLYRLRANLIFSAHTHTSHISIRQKSTGSPVRTESLTATKLESINLEDDSMVEIVVPTCSYRMGVRNMGYGAAVIDRLGRVSYAVLWLPSRFKHLHIYLAVALCAGVVLLAYFCNRRSARRLLRGRAKLAGV